MPSKKLAIVLAVVLSLILFLAFFLFRKQLPNNPFQSPKTWEITLSFNSDTQKLSLKKLTLLDKLIRPDYRGANDSAYALTVSDKANKPLYQTKIHITEELSYSIFLYPQATVSAKPNLPKIYDSTVFIPWFENASQVQIDKDNQPVLKFDLNNSKASLPIQLAKTAYAQANQTSGPLKVVIIGDSFPSESQFQQQAQTLISALQGAPPYSEAASPLFDFVVGNTVQFLGCFANPFQATCTEANIRAIGHNFSPTAGKFIVLTYDSQAHFTGLTNDVGGDISLIGANLPSGVTFNKVSVHEFLGHSVGELYDRYALTSKPGIKRGIKSNCSDNPSGESFWRGAGANGPYPQGCDSPNLYAPFPNDCPAPPIPPGYQGPIITSGGSRGTIMGVCAETAPGFDSVEQAWIRTQIIPRYQGVVTNPSPTPLTSAANDCSFSLTNAQFVRGDVLTQISATRAQSNYYLSFVLLNSKIGNVVGAVNQSNNLSASWNSQNLFDNGPVTLRCIIQTAPAGGTTIFRKDVTVNVQN